jgi:hypothetical protein
MRKLMTIAMFLVSGVWCLAQRQTEISYKTKFNGKIVDILVYVPVGYDPKSPQKYAAMIWHHGKGEKCWECGEMTTAYPTLTKAPANGLTKYIEDGLDLPFIVFSPRCIFGGPDHPTIKGQTVYRQGEWTAELFDTLLAKYPKADPNNLFLGGLSAGAAAVLEYVSYKKARRLKGAIVCAGWCPGDTAIPALAANNIPIYDSRADGDAVGGLATNMASFYNKAISKGLQKPKMVVYTGSSHDAGWVNLITNNNAVISTKSWDIAPSANNKWQDWVMSKTNVPVYAPPVVLQGTGLKAEYSYKTTIKDTSGYVTTCTTSKTTTIAKLDISGKYNVPPIKGMKSENWELLSTGFITVPKTEEYTFYVTSDDGSSLAIAGATITNDYSNHAARTTQGKITMSENSKCPFRVAYYNATSDWVLRVEVSSPTMPRQVLPSEWLSEE